MHLFKKIVNKKYIITKTRFRFRVWPAVSVKIMTEEKKTVLINQKEKKNQNVALNVIWQTDSLTLNCISM